MAGIGLGIAALIVVLSVMNGFERELRTRILGSDHLIGNASHGFEVNAKRLAAHQHFAGDFKEDAFEIQRAHKSVPGPNKKALFPGPCLV